ncbi:MAG TPA: (2Fe-2S)-binding protein [Candidatus Deferrimicrobiaceae bacterium]
MISLNVNGKRYELDVPPNIPLLWALRDHLHLSGTKFGCGEGLCGACTVHVDGKAEFSCQMSAGDAAGRKITTIEGIPADHPLKAAWIEEEVSQCGYCQPGQIMRAAALLAGTPEPDDAAIDAGMEPNLCRCGSYPRIRKAIRRAASKGARGGAA